MEDKKLISVIVPCYNEQEVLPMFYKEIIRVSGEMQKTYPETEFEFLFIDDGSKDRTLKTLRTLAQHDSRVRYISFSRNFGKEAGIYAGLSNAKGDYCVVMDADLQHPPKFLPEMYEAVRSGRYDCATTRRVSRAGESKVRSWFARLFYKIMNRISQTEIVDGAQDFRFMTRQMVDAVLSMSEYNRFSKGIFSWVGFRVKYIEYENVERAAGTTAWSFWGLFRYSLEGIIGFSTAPLSVAVIVGLITCLVGLLMFIVTVIKKLVVGDPVAGYPTLICTILLFGGLQLFCTGILGLYLGKTYLEVKHRPIYLVRETEQNAGDFADLPETEAEDEKRTAQLEQAKRLKLETDEEFDAIVDAAFADEADEAEDAAPAEEAPAEIDRIIAAEAEFDGDGYDTDGNDFVPDPEEEFADEDAEYAADETDADSAEPESEENSDETRIVNAQIVNAPVVDAPEHASFDSDAQNNGVEAAASRKDAGKIADRDAFLNAQINDRIASLDEHLASLDGEQDASLVNERDASLDDTAEPVSEAEESVPALTETEDAAEPETAEQTGEPEEAETEPEPAPAPKKKEKFEIKIDYDSIDFDEDFDDDDNAADDAADAYGDYDDGGYQDDLDPEYDENAPLTIKDKLLDIWYKIVDGAGRIKDSISDKLNKVGGGGFDADAIERAIDEEAGYTDDEFYDEQDDADGYDDDAAYDDYDDGYDDDLDPEYDENAEDDDKYHGSHF